MVYSIGIAGPSCSGKTTLSRLVSQRLGIPLLHLDKYCLSDLEKPIVDGYPSYEQPFLYDGEKMGKDVSSYVLRKKSVLAEGFLLFCYPSLIQACSHRFVLDAPYEVLKERRKERSLSQAYDGVWTEVNHEADKAFLAIGEEEWLRYGAPQHEIPGVISLDGTRPLEENLEIVLSFVDKDVDLFFEDS